MTTTIFAGGAFTRINAAAGDSTPDVFDFSDQFNVATSSVRTSNSVTPTGYDTPATIAVSGGNTEYQLNGGAWTNVSGTLTPGDLLAVRHTSSASASTTVTSTVTINGVLIVTFDSTTAGVGGTASIAPIAAIVRRRALLQ